MFDFTQQVVVVTGAGSRHGIGRAIALDFARLGAKVAVTGQKVDGIQSTVAAVEAVGGEALGIVHDVASKESSDEMVKAVLGRWGRLDVLVNNAGISQKVTVEDLSLEDIHRLFAVNVYGLMLCSQSCLKPMKAAGYGRIVNLSSVSGKRGGGVFGGAHYSASKAAVLAFAKNLAREVSAYGITVNSVCPGLIKTDIWQGLSMEDAARVVDSVPVGRLGETGEVSPAVIFLASKEASYITGEEIDINGGSHMD